LVTNGFSGFFTVTLQVYFFLFTNAVTVVVPSFFAVTLPVLLTVATSFLLEDQVTLAFVPLILRVYVLPTYNDNDFCLV